MSAPAKCLKNGVSNEECILLGKQGNSHICVAQSCQKKHRKKMGMRRPWQRLPREIVDAPTPIQCQVGWGSDQPGLMDSVPAYGRGTGTT